MRSYATVPPLSATYDEITAGLTYWANQEQAGYETYSSQPSDSTRADWMDADDAMMRWGLALSHLRIRPSLDNQPAQE